MPLSVRRDPPGREAVPPAPARLGAVPGGPVPAAAAAPIRPAARASLVVARSGGEQRRRRAILLGTAGLAVLLHVLATVTLVEAPHLWPRFAGTPPPAGQATDPPVMELVEGDSLAAGGARPATPGSPAPPAPPAPQAAPAAAATQPPVDRLPQPPAPQAEPVPPAVPPRAAAAAPPPAPQQQNAPSEPEVDLDPTDGLDYARQDPSAGVIPAGPDNTHANKLPAYPRAAGRRGEEGSVEMLVSIGADGTVRDVQVAVSSGHPDLDQTATRAVSGWHFHPATKNGHPVATQMMQVFNYHIDRNGASR